jgi:uncharacterized Zn-finger protein
MAVQLNFYSLRNHSICWWTHACTTQGSVHFLPPSLFSPLCQPSHTTDLTSQCTGASNSFLFLLVIFMLFPLFFQSTSNELQPVHGEERQYFCDECGDSLSQHLFLIAHQGIHTGKRPFWCDVCNKSFSYQSALKTHQCIHTVKRTFRCDVCNKSFSHQIHLKTHQWVHTGERKFRCDICNKLFSHQIHLKTH